MSQKYSRQVMLGPGVLGLNGVALTTTPNSNAFGVDGFNQLMLDYFIVDADDGVSALTFYLATRTLKDTNWKRMKIGTAVSATGVETIYSRQFSAVISASDKGGSIPISICHIGDMRIEALTGTGAGAGDTITCTVTLGVL